MQEPADSDPAPPIDTIIEVSQSAIVLNQVDLSTVALSLVTAEALAPDEPLNRMERFAADWGAWIITFVERWHLQSAPSFIVDGHPITDLLDPAPSPTEDDPGATAH
ncbi:MAG: hypothetical protein ACXVDI_26360 [Ktedonobacterales bacterium]